MTRKYMAALTAITAVAFVSVVGGTGCQSTGVGDPCIPEQEYSPSFLGFNAQEVNVESKSFQCQTRLCLVNHFQGRVSCPYGQNLGATAANSSAAMANGFTCGGNQAPTSQTPCCTPGVAQPVVSDQDCPGGDCQTVPNGTKASAVLANCSERTADKTVYCSCRCANPQGKTDDGANYCQCPDGFSCTQLIEGVIQGADPGLVGAYCIKKNTDYSPTKSCTPCDPTVSSGPTYCGSGNTAH
jgi:hypothetical protein